MVNQKKTPQLRQPRGTSNLINLTTYDVLIAMGTLLTIIWALF